MRKRIEGGASNGVADVVTGFGVVRTSPVSHVDEIENRRRLKQRKAAMNGYSIAKLVYGYLVNGVRIIQPSEPPSEKRSPRRRARSR